MIDISDTEILFFVKFGNKENIYDLYENGTIYFNTIDYFQKLENHEQRGDHYEGTTKITNYNKDNNITMQFNIPNTKKPIIVNPINFHLREFLTDIKGNIYCLYSIKTPEIFDADNFSIDKRVKGFGSYFVIIQDCKKFLYEIGSELKRLHIEYKMGLIDYYDKNKINGNIGPFNKPIEFEYQREFRIILKRELSNPFEIKIGGIKDYSMIFETTSIDDIKVKIKKQ